MKKVFCCKDLGIACDWEGSASSVEELLTIVEDHARNVHNMRDLNEAILIKIKGNIRDAEE